LAVFVTDSIMLVVRTLADPRKSRLVAFLQRGQFIEVQE